MKTAIIQLPGLNRDRDMFYALKTISGRDPIFLWAHDTEIPKLDLIVIPGGFSYGDYLRCGAIAARTPILKALYEKAKSGILIMGVCNGFQILLEMGLLPGALLPNQNLKFISKLVQLEIKNTATPFTKDYQQGQIITLPIAHHDGNYYAAPDDLKALEDNGQIALTYHGNSCANGSIKNIAGITDQRRRIFGLMPHPENYIEKLQGGEDGRFIFTSLLAS